MNYKRIIYATLIDFVGIILFLYFMLFVVSLIFPLICYIITWKYFKEEFWKAFLLSIILMIALLTAIILLPINPFDIMYTPFISV